MYYLLYMSCIEPGGGGAYDLGFIALPIYTGTATFGLFLLHPRNKNLEVTQSFRGDNASSLSATPPLSLPTCFP